MKRLNLDIGEEFHRRLKMQAAKEGKTLKTLVLEALEKLLREREEADK